MPDPYLMAMMGGEFAKKKDDKKTTEKNRFDLIIDKNIEEYLDTFDFETEIGSNKLQTPQMKRTQLRSELQGSLQMTELNQSIVTAFKVLALDGKEALESDEYDSMINELLQIGDKINNMSFDPPSEENFQTLFNISDNTMKAIFKVATTKFVNGQLDSCLAIFMMLTALNPGHPEYWLRSGMAAHQSNKMDLALRSYQAAAELDPQLIGPPLLIADCCLRLGNKEEAQLSFKKAQAIANSREIDPDWNELLTVLVHCQT